jgi:hypothetical protein
MTRDEALRIRTQVEAGAAALPDMDASVEPTLSRAMHYDGKLIPAGTRINWGGTLKQARTDLWATEQNNPDNAPNLWETVVYRDGYREIPEQITAENAFNIGDRGWWKDVLYESTIAANVWTPDQYPGGWKAVDP